MRPWLALLRPGDWLVMLAGLAAVGASAPLLWRSGVAELAVVKRDGRVVAELPLTAPRKLDVVGPLGTTVIEVRPGRARVARDPGPRQYCVLQGWLTRPNAIAICAPNHVSLQLAGPRGEGGGYDSLNY
ncbi:MAG: NusG domain II-containing protein [Sulfurisoma sp.]|nr:NusG domain II-containing protein [Sulfurisoma sp.]